MYWLKAYKLLIKGGKKKYFSCFNDFPCTYLQFMLNLIQLAKLKKIDFRKDLTPLCNFIQHGLARSMMICCPDISPYNHSGFFFSEILSNCSSTIQKKWCSLSKIQLWQELLFSRLLKTKKWTKDDLKSFRIIFQLQLQNYYIYIRVMRVGSDTYADPILQKGLQN